MCLAASPPPFVQCGPGELCAQNSFFFSLGKGGGGGGSVNEIFFQLFLNGVLLILKNF